MIHSATRRAAPPGAQAPFTDVDFLSVLEYRWIAFHRTYLLRIPMTTSFKLIEILESEQIATLLDSGMLLSAPGRRALG